MSGKVISIAGNGKAVNVPFINRSLEMREGMSLHYWSDKDNSLISSTLRYGWGIMINGVWFWRNYTSLPNTPENNVSESQLKALAIADTQSWFAGSIERLTSFL